MILNELSRIAHAKRAFDPNNKVDLSEYSFFLTNSKWKERCPFWLEWPYQSVPSMIKDKIIDNMFKVPQKNK